MHVTVYIPYAYGDAVKDFRYEGEELTAKKYVKMEKDEYYGHKDGVDYMVVNSLGQNMAINNYSKRKINVKKQKTEFNVCDGNIRGLNGREINISTIEDLAKNEKQTVLMVYLDQNEIDAKPDLETDIKMWIQDSQKVTSIESLSEEEKIFHLPKKDFKIDFDDGKRHALLRNCKFAKLLSTSYDKRGKVPVNAFAILVERIVLIK